MNNLQELKTTEEIQDSKKKELKENLRFNIFSEEFSLTKVEFEGDTLIKAKVNTNEVLDQVQMEQISMFCEMEGLTYQISRSGAGMKIEFIENQG